MEGVDAFDHRRCKRLLIEEIVSVRLFYGARIEQRTEEMGVDVRVTDALSARAVLNYTWGEQEVAGSDAEPADRIPPLNGRVLFTYDSGRDYRLESWARFADAQDRLSARDVRDSRIDPQGTPGWIVVGARLQKEIATNWRLSIAADNLLDKRYRVHGSGLDAPGRNFMISARYVWQ